MPVYRRAAGLAFAIIPVVIIFSIWDIVGILRDHWSYSTRFTTGWKLIFGMPVEELVFFVVVPICGLLDVRGRGLCAHSAATEIKSGRGRSSCLSTPCSPLLRLWLWSPRS